MAAAVAEAAAAALEVVDQAQQEAVRAIAPAQLVATEKPGLVVELDVRHVEELVLQADVDVLRDGRGTPMIACQAGRLSEPSTIRSGAAEFGSML